MPASPDIIEPLTPDPTGPQAWIWIDCQSVDRAGTKTMNGIASLDDTWRVSWVLRASLAINGQLVLTPDGKEISVDLPSGYRSGSVDMVDIIHDPEAAQAAALTRSVLLRLVTGQFAPQAQP